MLELYLHQANTEKRPWGFKQCHGYLAGVYLARLTTKSARRVPFYVCAASGCQT